MTIFYFGGYLKAVWLKIFGPVFLGFLQEIDPGTPPRSPGPAPHINFHEKSAPETNSNAISRHPKSPARLLSGTQCQRTISSSLLVLIMLSAFSGLQLRCFEKRAMLAG